MEQNSFSCTVTALSPHSSSDQKSEALPIDLLYYAVRNFYWEYRTVQYVTCVQCGRCTAHNQACDGDGSAKNDNDYLFLYPLLHGIFNGKEVVVGNEQQRNEIGYQVSSMHKKNNHNKSLFSQLCQMITCVLNAARLCE